MSYCLLQEEHWKIEPYVHKEPSESEEEQVRRAGARLLHLSPREHRGCAWVSVCMATLHDVCACRLRV